MAVKFAIASGNWSSGATWDNGVVPVAGDDVFANGFTVTLDTNASVNTLRNENSPVYVTDIATPAMTSNVTPSGVANASSVAGGSAAWRAFDQALGTNWSGGVGTTGWLYYQFPVGKIIKRYAFYSTSSVGVPRSWTFEGSNDGVTWTVLDTRTNFVVAINTWFTSSLANLTSYTYYRLNITNVAAPGNAPTVSELSMTESTSTNFGGTAGGTFSFANGVNFTCTQSTTGIVVGAVNQECVTFSLGAGNSATLNANVTTNFNTTVTSKLLLHSGAGTLNLVGNFSADGPNSNSNTRSFITFSGTGILNVTGTLGNTVTGGNVQTNTILVTGAGTVNVTGTVSNQASGTGNHATIRVSTSGTVTVSGNVSASNTAAAINVASGNVTINGNVTVSSTGAAITHSGAGNITVSGDVTASTTGVAILTTSTSTVGILNGNLYNSSNGFMAYQGYKMYTSNAGARGWYFTKSDTTARPMLDASQIVVAGPQPAVGDVRSGVSYGLGLYTGTCVLPPANTVALGTLIDVSTTGTAVLPSTMSTQLWNTLVSSLVTSGSIGERLKNCATVDMTGYQIAALL